MQRMAALQEQERIAAVRVEEENRAAEQRAREAQERKVREEEARRQEDEALARRLQEKEARMMAQWGVDDDSLMAHVAQQMKAAPAATAAAAATATAAAAADEMDTTEEATPEPAAAPAASFDIERVAVFAPTDKAVRPSELDDIPDDFYELTLDDLRAIKQAEKEARQGSEGFMTREMRERKRQKKWAAFATCSVRVRLPDRVEVMNQFPAAAHISDLYRFVQQCLVDAAPAFELYTTPPLAVLRNMNQSFVDSHLVPAAIVPLRWKGDTSATTTASSTVLRPELVAKMQSVAPQVPRQRTDDAKKGASSSSKSSKSTGAVCSVCLAGNLRLCHCVECDNNFCLACWKTVHDPAENPDNAHHHMGQVPSPTAAGAEPGTGARRTPPAVASDPATAAQQRGMPKWFRLGKKF